MSDENSAPAETEKPTGGYVRFGSKPDTHMQDGLLVEPGDEEHDKFLSGYEEIRRQAAQNAGKPGL